MSGSCPIHAFPWPVCPLVEGASPFGNTQQQACIFQFNEVASRLAIRNICRESLMVFAGANLITGLQLRQQNLLSGIWSFLATMICVSDCVVGICRTINNNIVSTTAASKTSPFSKAS